MNRVTNPINRANVPLRHLLNAKPLFMSSWMSAFIKVNDCASRFWRYPFLHKEQNFGAVGTIWKIEKTYTKKPRKF